MWGQNIWKQAVISFLPLQIDATKMLSVYTLYPGVCLHFIPWCLFTLYTLVSVYALYLGVCLHFISWCLFTLYTLVSVYTLYLGVSPKLLDRSVDVVQSVIDNGHRTRNLPFNYHSTHQYFFWYRLKVSDHLPATQIVKLTVITPTF